ncbi:DUF1801 domain-containing protein [Cellulomonas phragmiteti]|uniref:YdhG-like domain-containing protein n=1 Tax=Cellulomonas phragmiteti TaxID=478780 RepID=A0ABQ4DNU4_9CELL|nr:DUF1801 domain-containing protein [Cellulomonas phragmiteti]GIG41026.1 hypothetical protein Cph01nite_27880 [Cellulomonas phragmiteti]
MAGTVHEQGEGGVDVGAFLAAVTHERRRDEAHRLVTLFARATGQDARMWGGGVVGFGRYHYRYATGRQGDAAAAGFSPRKAALTLYFPLGFEGLEAPRARLGPHTTSASCLYVKRLDAIDTDVLEDMVRRSYDRVVAHVWE